MPTIILLLILLLLVGVAWRAERLLNDGEMKDVSLKGLLTDATDQIAQLLHDARASVRRTTSQPDPRLAGLFKEWVKTHLDDEPQLQTWLLGLNDEALRMLTQQIHAFYQQLNFDLMWLVDETIGVEAKVYNLLRESTIVYCHDCMEAVSLQPQVNAFRSYQQLIKQLKRGESPALATDLLNSLQANNMVNAMPPSLMLASTTERQQHLINQIEQAAQQDNQAFQKIWIELSQTKR